MGPERMVEEWVLSLRLSDCGRYIARCFRDGVLLESVACQHPASALADCWQLVASFDRARKTVELPAVVLP